MTTPPNHIPRLTPLALEAARERLKTTQLSPRGKAYIEAMLEAASNPDSEAPEVVMRTLPPERQSNMQTIAREYDALAARVTQRGSAALLTMDDADWSALLDAPDE